MPRACSVPERASDLEALIFGGAIKPRANNERVYRMAFASVYPHYVAKAESRFGDRDGGGTKEELHALYERS